MLEALAPALALALLVALVLAFVVEWSRRVLRRRALRRRFAHAAEGERRAATLLEGHGDAITDVQPRARYALLVDGAPSAFDVRADYLVERRGRRYIAEVKTGAHAPRLDLPATRRQILEYGLAFQTSGVLLVDADAERVTLIELSGDAAPARVPASRSFALAFGVFVSCLVAGSALALLR